jgi:hypothetical protein
MDKMDLESFPGADSAIPVALTPKEVKKHDKVNKKINKKKTKKTPKKTAKQQESEDESVFKSGSESGSESGSGFESDSGSEAGSQSEVEESDNEDHTVLALPQRPVNFKLATIETLEKIDEALFDEGINNARCYEIEKLLEADRAKLVELEKTEKTQQETIKEMRQSINNDIKQRTTKLNYIRSHKKFNRQAVQAKQGWEMKALNVGLKRGVADIRNKRIEGVCDGHAINGGRRCGTPAVNVYKGRQYCEKHFYDVWIEKAKNAEKVKKPKDVK